ncbi:MAG: hypothetical protein KAT69_06590 [Candidatus Aminicenantes bacterium]|nr:hypothetical protein [Candidatus Aminicenantes bacterium]
MNEDDKPRKTFALYSALSHLSAAQGEIEPFDDLRWLAEKLQALRFEIDQEMMKQGVKV